MSDEKVCNKCNSLKSLKEFEKWKNYCRACHYVQKKARGPKLYEPTTAAKGCNTCKLVLPATEFYTMPTAKAGLAYHCKTCAKERVNKQYLTRAEKVKKKASQYYHNNKESIRPKRREYQQKLMQDVMFRLTRRLRNRLYYALRTTGWKKDTNFTKYIGCDEHELIAHIEKQFTDGMTWDVLLTGAIHIDHIIPLSSAQTEDELYKLCHYSNLQPMWAEENIVKGCKIAS
jgi:uncharacterized protein (DUF2132 family)